LRRRSAVWVTNIDYDVSMLSRVIEAFCAIVFEGVEWSVPESLQ